MLKFVAMLMIMLASSAMAEEIIVGYTVSNSGKYIADSLSQSNGYQLWAKQVNAKGGISLGGKQYTIKLVTRDDQSKPELIQELYTRLVIEDGADFLFSPYSSGLTANAAIISEQFGKIMVAAGAADNVIFTNNSYLYQIYSPATSYFVGAFDIVKARNSKIAILYEDDAFSKAVALAAEEYASSYGLSVVLVSAYDSTTTDFTAEITKLVASKATVLIGGGHYKDGAALAKQIKDRGLALDLISLLVAPDNQQFSGLRDAALNVTVPVQWSTDTSYKPNYGPTTSEFISAYKSAYSSNPGYHAAGGYAAGLVLQYGMENSVNFNSMAIARELNRVRLSTFFGELQFNPEHALHGLQLDHKMSLAQWQMINNQLTKVIVWPSNATQYHTNFGSK